MSFFKELVAEIKRELDNATAEFRDDLNKSIPGIQARTAAPSPQAVPPIFGGQQGVNPGVIAHQGNAPSNAQANRSAPTAQQPPQAAQAKKRRKKAPQPQQAQQPPTAARLQAAQAKKASFIHPHKLVANLTPAVARSSIIMSEVLGPPVAKRQNRRGWH